MEFFPCPCCGFSTLKKLGNDEICPVCWWHDDGQGDGKADEVWGGPNGDLSLDQGRRNFIADAISCPKRLDLKEKSADVTSFRLVRLFILSADDKLLEYKPDIWADVELFSTANGGRKGPTAPHFFGCPSKVNGSYFDCRLFLGGKGIVPGEIRKHVPICFLNPKLALAEMKKGDSIGLWEGKDIGKAVVTNISTEH